MSHDPKDGPARLGGFPSGKTPWGANVKKTNATKLVFPIGATGQRVFTENGNRAGLILYYAPSATTDLILVRIGNNLDPSFGLRPGESFVSPQWWVDINEEFNVSLTATAVQTLYATEYLIGISVSPG